MSDELTVTVNLNSIPEGSLSLMEVPVGEGSGYMVVKVEGTEEGSIGFDITVPGFIIQEGTENLAATFEALAEAISRGESVESKEEDEEE